jgi:hypothetical protein
MSDRGSPLGFILFAACASGLLWVYALLAHVPLR